MDYDLENLSDSDQTRLYRLWRERVGWRRHAGWLLQALFAISIAVSMLVQPPVWVVVILCVLLAIVSMAALGICWYTARVWKDIYFEQQFCLRCGYDLHATIEAGGACCPECGGNVNPQAYSGKVNSDG